MFGYLILLLFPALALISLFISIISHHRQNHWTADNAIITTVILALISVVPIGVFTEMRLTIPGDIASHQALQDTVDRARTNDWDGYETATIQTRIARSNSALAWYQKMQPVLTPFIPAQVHNVEPVE